MYLRLGKSKSSQVINLNNLNSGPKQPSYGIKALVCPLDLQNWHNSRKLKNSSWAQPLVRTHIAFPSRPYLYWLKDMLWSSPPSVDRTGRRWCDCTGCHLDNPVSVEAPCAGDCFHAKISAAKVGGTHSETYTYITYNHQLSIIPTGGHQESERQDRGKARIVMQGSAQKTGLKHHFPTIRSPSQSEGTSQHLELNVLLGASWGALLFSPPTTTEAQRERASEFFAGRSRYSSKELRRRPSESSSSWMNGVFSRHLEIFFRIFGWLMIDIPRWVELMMFNRFTNTKFIDDWYSCDDGKRGSDCSGRMLVSTS